MKSIKQKKYFTIYSPDYECSTEIISFDTKKLCIDFIRKFYPNSIIFDIDELNKTEDRYFGYDFYIKEKTIYSEFPEMVLTLTIYFDDYISEWISDYDVDISNKNIEYKEEKKDLFFSKNIKYISIINPEKELEEFFKEKINNEKKNYLGVIKYKKDYVLKRDLYEQKDINKNIVSLKNKKYIAKKVLDDGIELIVYKNKKTNEFKELNIQD